jgi:hypothetical protein
MPGEGNAKPEDRTSKTDEGGSKKWIRLKTIEIAPTSRA